VLVTLALVLIGCRGYGDVSKSVELTEKDSGRNVDVHVTDVLIITLDANHTTPFHWVLIQVPDPNVLEKVANTYEGSDGPPGTGGQEIWRFRAIGEGSANLELTYESLDGSPTGDRFSLGVRAQEGG
jgi:predicted secreted protein